MLRLFEKNLQNILRLLIVAMLFITLLFNFHWASKTTLEVKSVQAKPIKSMFVQTMTANSTEQAPLISHKHEEPYLRKQSTINSTKQKEPITFAVKSEQVSDSLTQMIPTLTRVLHYVYAVFSNAKIPGVKLHLRCTLS